MLSAEKACRLQLYTPMYTNVHLTHNHSQCTLRHTNIHTTHNIHSQRTLWHTQAFRHDVIIKRRSPATVISEEGRHCKKVINVVDALHYIWITCTTAYSTTDAGRSCVLHNPVDIIYNYGNLLVLPLIMELQSKGNWEQYSETSTQKVLIITKHILIWI